ncbi:MAG: hypothetical protein LBS69_04015 [Prevotellaceae bacterium]|jgi:hypothetical protein|nr:hypothetical protein [Prevotellaceae bacterium]
MKQNKEQSPDSNRGKNKNVERDVLKEPKKRGLKKGKTNNPKGRKRGVPNKVSGEVKANLGKFINRVIYAANRLITDYNDTEALEKLTSLNNLLRTNLPYLVPKEEQKISVDGNIGYMDKTISQLFDNT